MTVLQIISVLSMVVFIVMVYLAAYYKGLSDGNDQTRASMIYFINTILNDSDKLITFLRRWSDIYSDDGK